MNTLPWGTYAKTAPSPAPSTLKALLESYGRPNDDGSSVVQLVCQGILICFIVASMLSLLRKPDAKKSKPLVVESGTWKKVGKDNVLYTPGYDTRYDNSRVADSGGSYSSRSDKDAANKGSNWVFFSPRKQTPFHDHSSSATSSPHIQNRDPYTDSRLMRKNLFSTFPINRQGEIMEALTRLYTTAHKVYSSKGAPSDSSEELKELKARATKTRLLLITLFTVFSDEFSYGMPLPRSNNTSNIGLAQALKDSCREKLNVNGKDVAYSQPASSMPEIAATELTEILGGAISRVVPSSVSRNRKDLGRLTGRILGALCRTGTGGDTYCAVTALFDIAGSSGKAQQAQQDQSPGMKEDDVADVFPFLILPGKVCENDEHDVPVRVTLKKSDDGRPVAEIVTSSILDVHLADEAMLPPAETDQRSSGSDSGKKKGRKNGMSEPAIKLKATIVEVVSMEIGCADRERMLRLVGVDI